MTERQGTRKQRFFAKWYPAMMQRVEEAGQGDIRTRNLASAHGRTLDLGTGNGFSVRHYPPAVSELVMLEPNPALRAKLQQHTADIRAAAWQIVDGDAYDLPFEDDFFDTVSASLLFCSLERPAAALDELARVLRPGGQFLFHEHVRGTGLRRVAQELITPLQKRFADGCHPNRDFEGTLRRSRFDITTIEHLRMPSAPAVVVPLVVGSAGLR